VLVPAAVILAAVAAWGLARIDLGRLRADNRRLAAENARLAADSQRAAERARELRDSEVQARE
jgi:hypothetical protein